MDDTLEEIAAQRAIKQNVGHRKSNRGGRRNTIITKQYGWRSALRVSLASRNKRPLLPLSTTPKDPTT